MSGTGNGQLEASARVGGCEVLEKRLSRRNRYVSPPVLGRITRDSPVMLMKRLQAA